MKEDIDQSYRSNSILENYNHQLQQIIPSNCSWQSFILGIQKEEFRNFFENQEMERKGETFESSLNFGKKYLPKWAEKKLKSKKSKQKKLKIKKILSKTMRNLPIMKILIK